MDGCTLNIMGKENIVRTLELHQKWLAGEPDGVRADLSGANLSGALTNETTLRAERRWLTNEPTI